MSRPLRALLCCLGVVALAGCRLDVAVDLTIRPDGTGELAVTATADADVLAAAPGAIDAIALDDALAAGWTVDGPTRTDGGGATIELRHPVGSAEEATNLLASLGAPFTDVRVARTIDGDTTTTTLDGVLTLPAAFDSFTDSDLLAAVGGTPFADEITAAGATPPSSMSVTFTARLPGDVGDSTGSTSDDGALVWQAPLDGSTAEVTATAVQRPARGWASIAATVALIALVAWIVVATAFIVSVARARSRRRRRRRERPVLAEGPDRARSPGQNGGAGRP